MSVYYKPKCHMICCFKNIKSSLYRYDLDTVRFSIERCHFLKGGHVIVNRQVIDQEVSERLIRNNDAYKIVLIVRWYHDLVVIQIMVNAWENGHIRTDVMRSHSKSGNLYWIIWFNYRNEIRGKLKIFEIRTPENAT